MTSACESSPRPRSQAAFHLNQSGSVRTVNAGPPAPSERTPIRSHVPLYRIAVPLRRNRYLRSRVWLAQPLRPGCKIWFILGMKVHPDNKTVPVENEHRVLSDW